MVTTTIKRLWFPKRINGKLHWLSKVKITKEHKFITVDGKICLATYTDYELLKGDD